MHAKREIPASSCPSLIENMIYSSGGTNAQIDMEEREMFRAMTELLDERAEKYKTNRTQKACGENRFEKRRRIGITGGEWCRVDTDGVFEYNGAKYRIDPGAEQYQPIETAVGDLYDMDRVLVTDDSPNRFYDMNYDEVKAWPL